MLGRGSEWRKWDLHVHTPASFEHNFKFADKTEANQYSDNIWDKYIDELERISDIAAIGITDYFSIEGYKKVLDYKGNGRLANYNLILPNIEFRLDKLVPSKGQNRQLNYHVIFSDKVKPNKIETEFLESLDITTPTGEVRKLTRANIEEIGQMLREQHNEFKKYTDYFVGCINITVTLEQVKRVLADKESIFGGKYMLVLPEEGWCLINWDSQGHLIRKQLLRESHAVFSANSNTRDWALGKNHDSEKQFVSEFGSLKPCLHGSDAHAFENLCKPDQERFCWVKADPTFEGLKQVLYEPEDRVRICEECPEPIKNIYTLSSIRIANSKVSKELELKEQEIPLNSNLVAVIGGKGNGKTALLDLAANCFEDRCARNYTDKSSFVQRIEEEKPDLSVTVSFLGDSLETFTKTLTEERLYSHSRITYLPQAKSEEYIGNRSKLHNKIAQIVFNSEDMIEAGYEQGYNQLLGDIAVLEDGIANLSTRIFKLEEETKKAIVTELQTQKTIKEGELKNKDNSLQELTKRIGDDSKVKVEQLKARESQLRQQHSKLVILNNDLVDLYGEITRLSDINVQISDINSRLVETNISFNIPALNLQTQEKVIREAQKTIKAEIAKRASEITKAQKALTQLSDIEKAHAALLKEIENIKREVQLLNNKLEQITVKKEQVKTLKDERRQKYTEFIGKHHELKALYERIIEVFSADKDDILNGIDFQANLFFDTEKFVDSGSDLFDLRRITPEQIQGIAEHLLRALYTSDVEEVKAAIEAYFIEVSKFKTLLKATRTLLDFYQWVLGNYFSLHTTILFDSTPMDKLSMGQKGTVLLKIFLAEGDHPLIIDQPEENLDNKFVYESLVNAFREAKKKRQIIIATHNANLVVNTDTEQVIVANFENNKISYRWGSLENPKLRNDITGFLEGGDTAFKRRELKYDIKD